MSKLSAAIFAAPLDLAYEDVPIDAWGVTVRVLEPDADRRAELAQSFVDAAESGVTMQTLYRTLITTCVVDPEDHSLVFTDDEAVALGAKEGRIVDMLATKAIAIAGLSEEAAAVPKDDSPETSTDATPTSSPTG